MNQPELKSRYIYRLDIDVYEFIDIRRRRLALSQYALSGLAADMPGSELAMETLRKIQTESRIPPRFMNQNYIAEGHEHLLNALTALEAEQGIVTENLTEEEEDDD